MKSRYSSKEALTLIKAERGLVKTIYSDHGHDEHWDFLLDQLADPENVRPLSELKDPSPQNRSVIFDRYTGLETKREVLNDHVRGEPKPGHENIKATAASLLPADGRMRLYNHSNTARAYESVAILFDTGLETDPEKSIVKHCYSEDSGTVTKFWIKGQDLLSHHRGRRPTAIPELSGRPAIQTLREQNRTFSAKLTNGQSRHHYERNEVRIKPRSRDVFAVAALNSAGPQGNQYTPSKETDRNTRINALYRKVYTMHKLKTDEGLPLEPGVVILEDMGVKEYPLLPQAGYHYSQVEDVIHALEEDEKEKTTKSITRATHIQALVKLIRKSDVYQPDFWEIIQAYRLFLLSECTQHEKAIFARFLKNYHAFISSPEEIQITKQHELNRESRKLQISDQKKKEEAPIHAQCETLLATNQLELDKNRITKEIHKKNKKKLIKERVDLIKAIRQKWNADFLKNDKEIESRYQAEKRARFIQYSLHEEKITEPDRKIWSEIVTHVDEHNQKNILKAYKTALELEVTGKTSKAAEAKKIIDHINQHIQSKPITYPAYRPKPTIPASTSAKDKEAILKQYESNLLKDHQRALQTNALGSKSHEALMLKAKEFYALSTIQKLINLGIPEPEAFYQKMRQYLQEQTAVTFAFDTKKVFTSKFSVKMLNIHEKNTHGDTNYAAHRLSTENTCFSMLPNSYKQYFNSRISARPRYASFQFVNGNKLPLPIADYGLSYVVFHPHVLQNMLFVPRNAYSVNGNVEPCSFYHPEILLKQFTQGQLKSLSLAINPNLQLSNSTPVENFAMEAYVPPINILDNQVISHIHINQSEYVLGPEEKALINAREIQFTNTPTNKLNMQSVYQEINQNLAAIIQTDHIAKFKTMLQAHPILPRLQKEAMILQAMRAGSLEIFKYLVKQKKQDPLAALPLSAQGDWKKIVPASKHAAFQLTITKPENILKTFDENQKLVFALGLLDAIHQNDFLTLDNLLNCMKKLTITQFKSLLEMHHPFFSQVFENKKNTADELPIKNISIFNSIQTADYVSVYDRHLNQWRKAQVTTVNSNNTEKEILIHYEGTSSLSDSWISYSQATKLAMKWIKSSHPLTNTSEFTQIRVGDKLFVIDTVRDLLNASVLQVKNDKIYIHYEGHSSKWDEWLDYNAALKRVELVGTKTSSTAVNSAHNLELICLTLSLSKQADVLKILLENQFAKVPAVQKQLKDAVSLLPTKEKILYQETIRPFERSPESLEALGNYFKLLREIETLSLITPLSKQNQSQIQKNFKEMIKLGNKYPELIIEDPIPLTQPPVTYCSFQFFIRFKVELPGLKALFNVYEKAGLPIPEFKGANHLLSLAVFYHPDALIYLLEKLPFQLIDLSHAFASLIPSMYEPEKLKLMQILLTQGKIPLSQEVTALLLNTAAYHFGGSKDYTLFQIYEKDLKLDDLARVLEKFLENKKETEVKRMMDSYPGIIQKTIHPTTGESLVHRFLDSLPDRNDLQTKSPSWLFLSNLLKEYPDEKLSSSRSILSIATQKRDGLKLILIMLVDHQEKFLLKNILLALDHALDRFNEEKSWDSLIIQTFLNNPNIRLNEQRSQSLPLIEKLIPSSKEMDRAFQLDFHVNQLEVVFLQLLKLSNPKIKDQRIQDFADTIPNNLIQEIFHQLVEKGLYALAEHLMSYATVNPDQLDSKQQSLMQKVLTRSFVVEESFIFKLCQVSKKSMLSAVLKETEEGLLLQRTQSYLKHATITVPAEALAEWMTKLHRERTTSTHTLLLSLLMTLHDVGGKYSKNTKGFSQCLMEIERKFPGQNISPFYQLFFENPNLPSSEVQIIFRDTLQRRKLNQASIDIFVAKGAHLDSSILNDLIQKIYKSAYKEMDSAFLIIETLIAKQKPALDASIKDSLILIMMQMIKGHQNNPKLLESFIGLMQKTGLLKLIEKETSFVKTALSIDDIEALKLLTPVFKENNPEIAGLIAQSFILRLKNQDFTVAENLYSLKAHYCDFNIDEKDNQGFTALHHAIHQNNNDWIYRLVNANADLCTKNPERKSAFILWFEPKVKAALKGSNDPNALIAAYQKVWDEHFIQPPLANAHSFQIDATKKQALYTIVHDEMTKQLSNLGDNLCPHQGPSITLDNPELLNALLQRDFTTVIAKFRQVELTPGVRMDNRQILANNPRFAENLESLKHFFAFNEKAKTTPSFEERVLRFNTGNVDKEDNCQDMLIISSRLTELSDAEKARFMVQVKFYLRAYLKSADFDLINLKDDLALAKVKQPDLQLDNRQKDMLAEQTGLYLMTQFLCTYLDNKNPADNFFLDHRIKSIQNMGIITNLMIPPKLKIDKKQVEAIVKTYHHNKWHLFGQKSKPIAQSEQSRKLLNELENNQISDYDKYHLVQRFLVSKEASQTTLANVLKSELHMLSPEDAIRAKNLHANSYKYRLRQWLKMPLISQESQKVLDDLEKAESHVEKYYILINYLYKHSDKRLAKTFEEINPLFRMKK